MKKPITVIFLILIIVMIACNNNKSKVSNENTLPVKQQQTSPESFPDKNDIKNIHIDKVDIIPSAPTIASTISVNANIQAADIENLSYNYIFWVNGEKFKETNENAFSLNPFKKGDFIYADVIVLKDEKEILRKRSSIVKILNSSPNIDGIDYDHIYGPGTYKINVNAKDADNDPLDFSIESKKPLSGISIDSKKGIITCELKDNPPDKITFFVIIKDNDAGEAKQEVTLNFKKNPEGKIF